MKQTRFGRWLRRHWLVLVIIVAACLVTSGGLWWYSNAVSRATAAANQASQATLQKLDEQLAAQKAAKAAALKAQQEAAAKAVAAAAQTATEATAGTLNSSACNTATTHNDPSSIDVLVNKKHCIQPLTYAPTDLVTSNGATLSAKAITAYNQMYAAATAAGEAFLVSSSYRSYADQVSTYAYWVSTSGIAGADTYSARPGYSEHQTGLAFDAKTATCALSCFGSTSQYTWLQQHASDYGFIQRYPSGYESITGYEAEEWHYRYVGVAVAKDMQAKGIKTPEQYWGFSGGDY